MTTWQLQEAKGKLSEEVQCPRIEGPQGLTARAASPWPCRDGDLSDLIDTPVSPELACAKPGAGVLDWFANTRNGVPFSSVLTLGEIRQSGEKPADIQRREKSRVQLAQRLRDWAGLRILPAAPMSSTSQPNG